MLHGKVTPPLALGIDLIDLRVLSFHFAVIDLGMGTWPNSVSDVGGEFGHGNNQCLSSSVSYYV